jgi:hypothetical protein
MPTKPLDRLMFVQGGVCFFCKERLPKAEASVEHLLASASGGGNSDENCVACCKAVNALLGSKSLKEKFQIVLNQKGQFKCPNGAGSAKAVAKPQATVIAKPNNDKVALVVANLKQRGNSKPRTLKTLMSTVSSLFPKGISEADLTTLVEQLKTKGKIIMEGKKVSYTL